MGPALLCAAAALLAACAAGEASVKARVEAGEGVPFFEERFSCREDGGAWSAYRELVAYARLRIFEQDEGPELASALAAALLERTSNLSRVLQCNVGVVAGFHLLARHSVAKGEDWRAYRLLQLALIYIFTLRNANQVPEEAGRDWATRSDSIIQEIKLLRERLLPQQRERWAQLPPVAPDLRVRNLDIAVVSICAYPKDHPMVLRVMTPENRRLYAERHGYHLHVHLEHPLPGAGVHIQHAKLELMARYLRSGKYDWVAWFDCDSILMNFDRTLDAVVARYARRAARVEEAVAKPQPGGSVEVVVAHVGSCNSAQGCWASGTARVDPSASYVVSVQTALVDMASENERLASVIVGGQSLGECNPSPESDYDCGFHSCFQEQPVPQEAVATGRVQLLVHAVRTHSDCRCSRLHGSCYSTALAAYEEAANGDKATDPAYGLFVKFLLTPVSQPESSPSGCCCSSALRCPAVPAFPRRVPAPIRRLGAECAGPDVLLAVNVPLEACLSLCRGTEGCRFVAHGLGRKAGQCHWELSDCLDFEEDSFNVYDVAEVSGHVDCARSCAEGDETGEEQPAATAAVLADDGVDLLITEEGWGLSSANWLIRRSAWSIRLLERAFALCHRQLPLFGDQDALIQLLLSEGALRGGAAGDPLDPHCAIVPQRELNAYDALNAYFMGCDAFQEGDLLVTFPGCRDASACNPLFRMAFAHALEEEGDWDPVVRARLLGPPELAAAMLQAGRL